MIVGGRYRIERPLGGGGMATVHLARDDELERPVAVKLLEESLAADPELRARFVREARLAARLSHPNVVQVFDAGEDGGRPYIVMEYVEGETLAEALRRGPLTPERAADLGLQACAGLAHAHAAGLVHRDVKPQNLLLRGDGTVKIADFGIARAAEGSRITQAGTILGTAAYLAPEQGRGEEVTPKTDVFALGAVLYEALSGRPPRPARTLRELDLEAPVAAVGDVAPGIPARLEEAVMRALARDPAFRPDADELAAELRGEEPTRPTEVRRGRYSQTSRRRVAAAALAAAAVLVLAGGAVVLAAADGDPEPRPAPVEPVPSGGPPEQDARELADWLRRYSA